MKLLSIEFEFDETDYDEEPDFDYNELKQNVTLNFSDFNGYSIALDSNTMELNIKINTPYSENLE